MAKPKFTSSGAVAHNSCESCGGPVHRKARRCIGCHNHSKRKPDGKFYVMTAGHMYEHVAVWQHAHGLVPNGFVIRHKDGNIRNNALNNLECITRQHSRWLYAGWIRQDGEWLKPCRCCGATKSLSEFEPLTTDGQLQRKCLTCRPGHRPKTQKSTKSFNKITCLDIVPLHVRPRCECGCGGPVNYVAYGERRGEARRFIRGHSGRIIDDAVIARNQKRREIAANNPPATKSSRTSRERARKKIDDTACAWQRIGECKGPIQCAHVDQNPFNNDPANLLPLCASHHGLLDHGRIDPSCPIMPHYYTDRFGKRRYGRRKRQPQFSDAAPISCTPLLDRLINDPH